MDPTKTLPPRQIANGLVDAVVHITEQYPTYPAGDMAQNRFAQGLLQTMVEIGPLHWKTRSITKPAPS